MTTGSLALFVPLVLFAVSAMGAWSLESRRKRLLAGRAPLGVRRLVLASAALLFLAGLVNLLGMALGASQWGLNAVAAAVMFTVLVPMLPLTLMLSKFRHAWSLSVAAAVTTFLTLTPLVLMPVLWVKVAAIMFMVTALVLAVTLSLELLRTGPVTLTEAGDGV